MSAAALAKVRRHGRGWISGVSTSTTGSRPYPWHLVELLRDRLRPAALYGYLGYVNEGMIKLKISHNLDIVPQVSVFALTE